MIMHPLIYKVKSFPNFLKANAPSFLSPDFYRKSPYTSVSQEQIPSINTIYASYQIELHLRIDHMMYDVENMLYFVLFILLEVEASDFPQYSTTPSDILLPSFLHLYFQKKNGKSP